MAFIERMIGPDEQLIGIARLHWIYGVKGLAWLGGLIALGVIIDWSIRYLLGASVTNPALGGILALSNAVFWICLLIGAFLFLFYFIMLLSTEVGLTTTRLVYKKGLIMVKTEGVDLEEVKGAYVNSETFGRFLNYGTLHFDARFIEDIELPAVADPYRFIKAMNDQRSQMKADGLNLVLDVRGAQAKQALAHQLNVVEPSDERPPPQLAAPQYKAFSDLEPLAMIEDLKQEAAEADTHSRKKQPPPAPESGPILLSDLREEFSDDFEESAKPAS